MRDQGQRRCGGPFLLPDDAVVLSRKPRLFYAFSGHRSSIYPFSTDPADFFATVDSINARYVVFDWLGGTSDTYLRPVLLRKSPAFCVMHATPATGTVLFGIRHDHASVPDAGEAGIVNAYAPSFALCDVNYWQSEAAQEGGLRLRRAAILEGDLADLPGLRARRRRRQRQQQRRRGSSPPRHCRHRRLLVPNRAAA